MGGCGVGAPLLLGSTALPCGFPGSAGSGAECRAACRPLLSVSFLAVVGQGGMSVNETRGDLGSASLQNCLRSEAVPLGNVLAEGNNGKPRVWGS